MENKIEIPKGKKVFFASDNHLGAPNTDESKIRESHFLNWLNFDKVYDMRYWKRNKDLILWI